MLLKSYLVSPRPSLRNEFLHSLSQIPLCEVIPADNHDAIILITSSASLAEDEQLEQLITGLSGFGNMSLVSGYCEDLPEDVHVHE